MTQATPDKCPLCGTPRGDDEWSDLPSHIRQDCERAAELRGETDAGV